MLKSTKLINIFQKFVKYEKKQFSFLIETHDLNMIMKDEKRMKKVRILDCSW